MKPVLTKILQILIPDDKQTIDRLTLSETLEKFSPLLIKLNEDLENFSADDTYRIIEFGCGNNPTMIICANALAKLNNKKIHYVGIDINERAIRSLNDYFTQNDALIAGTLQLIPTDASQFDWFERVDKTPFNAAIFINPIVEDPFEAAKDYDRFCKFSFLYNLPKYKRLSEIFQQYEQYLKIFNHVLPNCLVDDASLLMRMFYPQEYSAVVKTLGLAKGFEAAGEYPKKHCLVKQFIGLNLIEENQDETQNNRLSFFELSRNYFDIAYRGHTDEEVKSVKNQS